MLSGETTQLAKQSGWRRLVNNCGSRKPAFMHTMAGHFAREVLQSHVALSNKTGYCRTADVIAETQTNELAVCRR